ncbi:hypothetical protein DRO56_05085 [Candidatus Bathyarchaeota archaeon]|nr:MAG: hypothetical protein DRO56_05085 [Candidatus Bathyarchaeota archaeon]
MSGELTKPYPPTPIDYTLWNILVDMMAEGVGRVQGPSQIVYKAGLTYKRINGITGKVDDKGDNPSTILSGALENGYRVHIKGGYYKFPSPIEYPSDRVITGDGENTRLDGEGLDYLLQPPDETTWRNFYLRDLWIQNSGVHMGSINYGGLRNVRIDSAPDRAVKCTRIGGNVIALDELRIEANETTPVGVEVLADWVWASKVVVSKTTETAFIIGSANPEVKPYGIFFTNIHTYRCNQYDCIINKTLMFYVVNWHAELKPQSDPNKLGGIWNKSTNQNLGTVIWNFQLEPWEGLAPGGFGWKDDSGYMIIWEPGFQEGGPFWVWLALNRAIRTHMGFCVGDDMRWYVDQEGRMKVRQKGVNIPISPSETYKDLSLPTSEPDTSYGVLIIPSWNTKVWVTNKTTSGFRANFEAAPGGEGGTVDYFVYR